MANKDCPQEIDKNTPEIKAAIEFALERGVKAQYLVNCGLSLEENVWWLCDKKPIWHNRWQLPPSSSVYEVGHYSAEDMKYLPEVCLKVPVNQQVFKLV